MADVSQNIRNLEGVLAAMGYDLNGHEPGKMDAKFNAALDKAFTDLIRIGMGQDGATFQNYDSNVEAAILGSVKKTLADKETVERLTTYSKGASWIPNKIVEALQKEGFKDNLLTPQGVGGVLQFFGEAKTYLTDMRAVKLEQLAQQKAGPQKQQQAVKEPVAANGATVKPVINTGAPIKDLQTPGVPTPEELAEMEEDEQAELKAAAAQQEAQAKQNQAALKGMLDGVKKNLGIEGKPDADIAEALKARVLAIQSDAASGWTGAKDGKYSEEFHQFLSNSKIPAGYAPKDGETDKKRYGSLAISMEKMKGILADGYFLPSVIASEQPKVDTAKPDAKPGAPSDVVANKGNAGAASQAGANEIDVKNPPLEILPSVIQDIETFLRDASFEINDAAGTMKSKAGPMMGLMLKTEPMPAPGEVGGAFDESSQRSLQAILKSVKKQLDLSDDEIYNYSPSTDNPEDKTTGNKIKGNYNRLLQTLSPEARKKFDDGLQKIGGAAGLVKGLDILYYQGLLKGGQLYEGSPIQLTGMGASMLQWVMGFIGKIFPGGEKMVAQMFENFTGHSLEDLIPGQKSKTDPVERQRVAKLAPTERQQENMVEVYKSSNKALGDPRSKGLSLEQYEASFRGRILRATEAAHLAGIGTEEDRKNHTKAVTDALDAAAKVQIRNDTPEHKAEDIHKAAHVFADTLNKAWDPAVLHDPKTGLLISAPPKVTTVDPSTDTFRVVNGDRNTVIDTYNNYLKLQAAKPELPNAPLVFKQPDGTTWVAGVTDTNVFSIRQVTPEAMKALEEAALTVNTPPNGQERDLAGAALRKDPALDLLIGGYGNVYDLSAFNAGVRNVDSFPQLQARIQKSLDVESGKLKPPTTEEQLTQNIRSATSPRSPRQDFSNAVGNAGGAYAGPVRGGNNNFGMSATQAGERAAVLDSSRAGPVFDPKELKGGRMVVISMTDPTRFDNIALSGETNRIILDNQGAFQQIDISHDYARFMNDFNHYLDKNEKKLRDGGHRTFDSQVSKFASDYETKNGPGSLQKNYPELTKVVQRGDGAANYNAFYDYSGRTPTVNIAGLVSHLNTSMGNFGATKDKFPHPYELGSEKVSGKSHAALFKVDIPGMFRPKESKGGDFPVPASRTLPKFEDRVDRNAQQQRPDPQPVQQRPAPKAYDSNPRIFPPASEEPDGTFSMVLKKQAPVPVAPDAKSATPATTAPATQPVPAKADVKVAAPAAPVAPPTAPAAPATQPIEEKKPPSSLSPTKIRGTGFAQGAGDANAPTAATVVPPGDIPPPPSTATPAAAPAQTPAGKTLADVKDKSVLISATASTVVPGAAPAVPAAAGADAAGAANAAAETARKQAEFRQQAEEMSKQGYLMQQDGQGGVTIQRKDAPANGIKMVF